MATYFAQVEDGIVTQVIVASADFVATQPGTWVETFMDGAQRKNYAGISYSYDAERDAFIPTKPYESWILNDNCQWEAPVAMPSDGKMYTWNELDQAWVELSL